MDDAMKALVCGFGSIGRRHVRNLARLPGIDSVEVYTRIPGDSALMELPPKARFIRRPEESNADLCVVANDTSLHVATALEMAKKGMHLFIEKPVSHGLAGTRRLADTVRRRRLTAAVGYNLRYLGCLGEIRSALRRREIGKLLCARISAGYFLPAWRKGGRKAYSCFRSKGGGVDLDLSHELDYMRWLFGEPREWKVVKGRSGQVTVDSCDHFDGIYSFPGGFVCGVHLDYLKKEKERVIEITGSRGAISCDLVAGRLRIECDGKPARLLKGKRYFDLDATYVAEMKDFLACARGKKRALCGLEDAIKTLRLLEDGHV